MGPIPDVTVTIEPHVALAWIERVDHLCGCVRGNSFNVYAGLEHLSRPGHA